LKNLNPGLSISETVTFERQESIILIVPDLFFFFFCFVFFLDDNYCQDRAKCYKISSFQRLLNLNKMVNHHRSLFSLWLVTALLLSTENATAQGQGCGGVRERWAWTDHTCEEQDAFLEAVWGMKQSGVYDQFVNVHTQMNRAAHGNAEFLPWHRWFIYQFEQALQEESGNPCMTLPFWDWEDTSVFDEDTFDWFDGFEPENPRRCRWTLPNGQCLQRQRNRNVQLWRTGRTMGIMTNFRQYGDDFLERNPNRNNGFRAAFVSSTLFLQIKTFVWESFENHWNECSHQSMDRSRFFLLFCNPTQEGGPHTAPHTQIGGPMAGPLSASDPLFFVHHANVDRIWSLWQDFHDHDEVDKEDFRAPIHYEGGRLDRPMPFANHPRFRNGRNFPTPRDLLSNNDIVNVVYKNDQLVSRMGYNPNPRWAERATWGNQIWCDRRRFRERKKPPGIAHWETIQRPSRRQARAGPKGQSPGKTKKPTLRQVGVAWGQ